MPLLQDCVSGELGVIWGNHVSCDWVDGAALDVRSLREGSERMGGQQLAEVHNCLCRH